MLDRGANLIDGTLGRWSARLSRVQRQECEPLFVLADHQGVKSRFERSAFQVCRQEQRRRAGARDVLDEGLEALGAHPKRGGRSVQAHAQLLRIGKARASLRLRGNAGQVARRTVKASDRSIGHQSIERACDLLAGAQHCLQVRISHDDEIADIRSA